jgi:hypothetical protein
MLASSALKPLAVLEGAFLVPDKIDRRGDESGSVKPLES